MKIQISDDVVWRDLGGEVIILDLATQHYFGLTGAGNDMWRLMAETGSPDLIIERLIDKYDVEPARLKGDFDKLVEELAGKGMVKILSDERS